MDTPPAVASEKTCGICLEDSKDPLNLPCGHSFCDGCLNGWRSRYGTGVDEEMRTKCPTCRARIPPSKEMVEAMQGYRAVKKKLEDYNQTSSEGYRAVCLALTRSQEKVGADWDGVTILQDNNEAVTMPGFIWKAIQKPFIKTVLKWINANRTEDRVNAISRPEMMGAPALSVAAALAYHLELTTLLLQLGADVDTRDCQGITAIASVLIGQAPAATGVAVNKMAKLLLSWGANFFPDHGNSREGCISRARKYGEQKLLHLIESELGGRRCEIVNLITSRPELNGKTCVADEYLPDSKQYKVTLETKDKEVIVLGPDNLKRRDRTPQDCGYYIDFMNGRTIRRDFDSNEDCQAFVAAMNNNGETQPVVTEALEARAEQAAAELLAELGLDDSAIEPSSGKAKKSTKKKKGAKRKKKTT